MNIVERFSRLLGRTPLLKHLPPRAIAVIALLFVVNLVVWAIVGVLLSFHNALSGTAVLAYSLGLRHALDADHIAAIDLMTRRLVAAGQKPVTIGTWFSLGHSTIVVVTCIVVAATASAISKRFDNFSYVGGIIGSAVSAAFLILLGLVNIYLLVVLVRQMRRLLQSDPSAYRDQLLKLPSGGYMFKALSRLFNAVDRPWKMYPVGVLFGLGFDTSSEVALLGIASIKASTGTSIWLILIFPLLFTAAMCLLDTTDGALMMCLYTSVTAARDPVAVLYYNIVLTFLTCIIAVFIGTLQVLGLALSIIGDRADGSRFWRGVGTLQDRYDAIGGCTCGLFVIGGLLSMFLYRPWRRYVRLDEKMSQGETPAMLVDLEQAPGLSPGSDAKGKVPSMTIVEGIERNEIQAQSSTSR